MKSLFFVLPALLLGLTACGAPVAAVTLPDTVQVEKTQTAETAVLYEDADGREVSPRRAALTEWRWSVADDTIAEVDPSGIVTGLRGGSTTLTLQSATLLSARRARVMQGLLQLHRLLLLRILLLS